MEGVSTLLPRAWYDASISDFVSADQNAIVGQLAQRADLETSREQMGAWVDQVTLLKEVLAGLHGVIFLEFSIPRMGRRIDAVLLLGPIIFVLEFKVGAQAFDRSAVDQVWDYALDLKNFHQASHASPIVPILLATDAPFCEAVRLEFGQDGVASPVRINSAGLRRALDQLRDELGPGQPDIDAAAWKVAPYRPTPTIIEAARTLYAQHSVESIARHDAGTTNLRVTSLRLEELIEKAQSDKQKLICFVTGVPGSGKTLAGLDVATKERDEAKPTHSVFLSGNGPLVAVLRESLTRDELARRKKAGEKMSKAKAANPVKAFIQNVHHFRDEALRDQGPPADHVVIFDEAQRAWNRTKTANFMKQRKGQNNFQHSEPSFLISYLDRHADWAVIICLVGGGQEIHTGEAGIGEWLDAVRTAYTHWQLYISSQLTDTEYAAGHAVDLVRAMPNAHFDDHLHLAVSMRSFRADNVSAFVKALLDCDVGNAREALRKLVARFPILLTRDLGLAKRWVRSQARGSERYGLVASSKAMRLKPLAIDVRAVVDPVHWFLDSRADTRSSFYLEDCATEFQVQGLELDWACVTWDGDLRYTGEGWSHHDFRGDRWQVIRQPESKRYLCNAYRVLLTRARQGMVLFIPRGDVDDPTRSPIYYDPTFDYLTGLGLQVLA